MKSKNNLGDVTKPSVETRTRSDREDKHTIAAHFKTEAYREFKRLAADELKSTDALLHEAVALLFENRKRPVPKDIKKKLLILSKM